MRRKFTKKYSKLLENEGPLSVFTALHNPQIKSKQIKVFGWENEGRSSYEHNLINSVSKYLFEDLEVIEALIPEGLDNRPQIIKDSTKYICIHDTASAREGSGALAHKKYVCGGGGGTSWHYSLGNDGIFHHLPNNEVAYHAGDGRRTYELENSNVKASKTNPNLAISEDGFYTFNEMKSTILAPTNEGKILSKEDINDLSLEVQIGLDGNYYLGTTWYSQYYNLIGNGGGNRNSIGIESMIDRGSDIYLTWQRLAKLVALLLDQQKLDLDAVVQHHFFSGKDCPMTMRHAGMWDEFLNLVEAEYFIRTEMANYEISIEPQSANLAKNGRILNINQNELEYKLIIKEPEGRTYSKVLTSKL